MSRPLILYHRTGCHLCEDMQALLRELQPELGFSLSEVDILYNEELEAKYGLKIPVLEGDDGEICHYFLDQVALQRYFEGG